MSKAEEYYNKRFGEPIDKHEKKIQKHDYWDMVDFAEQYAQQVSREDAINFAGFYYDSVADDPTPKEITPEMLYDEFNKNPTVMKQCPICKKWFKSLGYARHMAMHRDKDRTKTIGMEDIIRTVIRNSKNKPNSDESKP